MNHTKRILAQLLFCFLSVMFLIVVGCSINDDTTTYTISGAATVYGTGDALANVTINLTGAATSSTATNSDGTFSFTVAANGTYTLTPSLEDYTFNPVSTVVISSANMPDTNFVATSTSGADTYSISGTVTGVIQSGVELKLIGGASGSVMTGSDGTYSFANVVGGTTYTVTPSLSGYTFNPVDKEFTIGTENAANIDFTSSAD
jgi:hypothetical protein